MRNAARAEWMLGKDCPRCGARRARADRRGDAAYDDRTGYGRSAATRKSGCAAARRPRGLSARAASRDDSSSETICAAQARV